MIRQRKDYPKFITPAGEAIFPAIHEPDYKFKKQDGEFHARIYLDPADPKLEPLLKAAQEIQDEAFEAKKDELLKQKKGALARNMIKVDILKEETDPETGEPTGKVILRAKLRYRVEIKNGPKAGEVFYKRPDVFDAKRNQLKNPPKVGSGSLLKLAVVPLDYIKTDDDGNVRVGIGFELEGVQILKLVTGGQRDADFYGFDDEEGDEIADGAGSGFDVEDGDGYAGDDEARGTSGPSGRDF